MDEGMAQASSTSAGLKFPSHWQKRARRFLLQCFLDHQVEVDANRSGPRHQDRPRRVSVDVLRQNNPSIVGPGKTDTPRCTSDEGMIPME